mgnify:CR=1 FL=1
MFKIGIIGRSGHAGRLINILNNKKINVISYHPKTKIILKKKIKYTNSFKELHNCKGIIISCPTFLHWFYLNKLKNFKGHILIEKPAVSNINQSKLLIPLAQKYKLKLNINFNLRNSELINKISKIIQNREKFGKIVSGNIFSSHGLAFKKNYYKNWRSQKKFSKGIMEVDTVHYIDLAIALFGNILDYKIFANKFATNKSKFNNDTITLLLKTKKIPFYIFSSYSSAFFFKLIIFGTNGIIEYDGNKITLKSPRNTFNKIGRFIAPKIKLKYKIKFEDMWRNSLIKSISEFILKIKKNKKTNYKILKQNMDAINPVFKI